MIQIQNSADTAKILISGDIGDSWFSEGFTLDKLKAGIGSEDVSNIELEISSLGGDLMEALAIYDSLRSSNARVKAKIIGSSASAATVIAMGADDVEISENSNFLIHRASTMAAGNVDDMDKAADELAMWDDKLLNIYQKRTGKRKSQISDLMKQDKWLTASEAIEWGFADRKIKTKITNKTEMDTTNLKALLGVENDEAIEAAVTALIDNNNSLKAVVDKHEADEAHARALEIDEYLNEAEKAGKITAQVKDTLRVMASSNFDGVKTIVEAAKPQALKDVVDDSADAQEHKMTKEEARSLYNSWKVRNKVARMAIDEPEKYNEVITALKS